MKHAHLLYYTVKLTFCLDFTLKVSFALLL